MSAAERFRDAHGYQPWADDGEDATAKEQTATDELCALVVELTGAAGSPMADAQAAAFEALRAMRANEHPSPVVAMGGALAALDDALQACEQAHRTLRDARQGWSMASQDADCWRGL